MTLRPMMKKTIVMTMEAFCSRRGPEIAFVNPRVHRGEFFRLSHRLHHLRTGPSRGSCSNTRAFYLNTLTSKIRMRLREPRLSPYASLRSSEQFVAVRCTHMVERVRIAVERYAARFAIICASFANAISTFSPVFADVNKNGAS